MATEQWYAVKVIQSRTGRTLIEYVQATSTQQAAETFPGSTVLGGGYPTQAAAEAAFPQGSAGTTASSSGNPTVSNAPVNPLGGLAGIGDFFGRLTEASTWVRVGEVVLGLVLLAVGIARITHAVPIATKIAGVAAKGAVLA